MFKLLTLLPVLFVGALPQGKGETKDVSAATRKATYALVVNANNKTTESGDAAKAIIKKLYLKDLTQWVGGTEAKPYSREAASAPQVAFQKDVLGMSESELARHWLRLKNMNGSTPPKEVDTDRMVLKYVAKAEGAFGIVLVDAAKGVDGVKVLFEF